MATANFSESALKALLFGKDVSPASFANFKLIRRYETLEGESVPYFQKEVEIRTEGGSENLFFVWPLNIVHVIDSESPFYNMSAIDLMNEDFEFVVYLEGTAESTGTSMQARYSYLPINVLWGHRFLNLITYNYKTENYSVDFSKFNSTYEIATPLCSAKDLEQLGDAELKGQQVFSSHSIFKEVICLESNLLEANIVENFNEAISGNNSNENLEVHTTKNHYVHFD